MQRAAKRFKRRHQRDCAIARQARQTPEIGISPRTRQFLRTAPTRLAIAHYVGSPLYARRSHFSTGVLNLSGAGRIEGFDCTAPRRCLGSPALALSEIRMTLIVGLLLSLCLTHCPGPLPTTALRLSLSPQRVEACVLPASSAATPRCVHVPSPSHWGAVRTLRDSWQAVFDLREYQAMHLQRR